MIVIQQNEASSLNSFPNLAPPSALEPRLFSRAGAILDIRRQDCKGIRVNEKGEHVNFVMSADVKP
jgi:hypothetical protein